MQECVLTVCKTVHSLRARLGAHCVPDRALTACKAVRVLCARPGAHYTVYDHILRSDRAVMQRMIISHTGYGPWSYRVRPYGLPLPLRSHTHTHTHMRCERVCDRDVQVPLLAVVENMVYIDCGCSKRIFPFGKARSPTPPSPPLGTARSPTPL